MKRILLFAVILLLLHNIYSLTDDWTPYENIKSGFIEYSPTISADGKTIIFAYPRLRQGDSELWISYYTNNTWTTPVNMRGINPNFSSSKNEVEPFLSYDGNALLFSSDRDGGYGAYDLYISYRNGKEWSDPMNFGFPINTLNSERMPSISVNNKELFFTRIPVDYHAATPSIQNKEIQIWTSRNTNGSWTMPQSLPPPVNELSWDTSPRIMPDNKTLIFASSRNGGDGPTGMWEAKRDKPGWPWHSLKNLHATNSMDNDIYFSFNIEQQQLHINQQTKNSGHLTPYDYFVKNQTDDPSYLLEGKITNILNGKPIQATLTATLVTNPSIKFTIYSAPSTGQYSLSLPGMGIYTVNAKLAGYMFYSEQKKISLSSNSKIIRMDIGLQPLDLGLNIVINTIYFDSDSYILTKDSYQTLDMIYQLLEENPSLYLLIRGHVAKVKGSPVDLQLLSEQRAKAVKKYLTDKGIKDDRLDTKGYGATKPIGDNNTEKGRKLNRRTEIQVLKN